MSRSTGRGAHTEPVDRQTKRAAIYCRVSSQGQAEDDKVSLSEQLAACEAYCAEHGYAVAARLPGRAPGSAGASRPADWRIEHHLPRREVGAANGDGSSPVRCHSRTCWVSTSK